MVSPTVYTYAYPFTLNATEPTDIHTLSLHDALPIWHRGAEPHRRARPRARRDPARLSGPLPHRAALGRRSEEHTSELQSRGHLVCRLLLEKKKKKQQPLMRQFPALPPPPPCVYALRE